MKSEGDEIICNEIITGKVTLGLVGDFNAVKMKGKNGDRCNKNEMFRL